MNNDNIGRLAGKLNALEDAGHEASPEYAAIKAEYEALKALPESWADVRASKRTPEQAALAAAWAAANGGEP